MRRTIHILLTCLALLAPAISFAQDVRNDSNPRDRERRDRGNSAPGRPGPGFAPWGNRQPPREQERPETVATGFVFFDGAFVERPYIVKQDRQGVLVNDRRLLLENGRANEIAANLQNGGAVVVFAQRPAAVLTDSTAQRLLRVLTAQERDEQGITLLAERLPDAADQTQWREWLASYRLPDAIQSEAVTLVANVEQLENEARVSIAANTRLHSWSYPLTVVGMVLAVWALGHLLQYPPLSPDERVSRKRRERLCRATIVFIGMICLFSGLDLTWTILTSQANRMVELNPLGALLIESPLLLTAAKISATVLSCGLLFALRQHHRAQLASWWLCLICTVLTFRWLVLNSMFVT